MDAGATWALAATFVAYHGSQLGWNAPNFFATAGLILFISLVQACYQQTYRDELTGIAGRTAYEEATAQLGSKFAIAVVAIDQVNSYAGAYGKPVVEQILKQVAPKVQAGCQAGRVFRVSGEELTLLYPDHSALEALVELDNIRKGMESTSLFLRDSHRVWENTRDAAPGCSDVALPITASVGVADTSMERASRNGAIKAAYRALYEAKASGGNVVKRGLTVVEAVKRASSGRIVTGTEY
jgi:diguanylate cyclase (GGDEF)-like protein